MAPASAWTVTGISPNSIPRMSSVSPLSSFSVPREGCSQKRSTLRPRFERRGCPVPHSDSEKPIELVAGPATALFTGGDLRTIRISGCETINRIYFALLDHNWGTIPGKISRLRVDLGEVRFLYTYRSEHRKREGHLISIAIINGETAGIIPHDY